MKKSSLLKLGVILSACSVLAAGCAVEPRGPVDAVAVSADTEVDYADSATPPVIDDPVPGPDYSWIDGSWVWGGNRWDWERGQ